jgi:choline-sulfatase
LRPNFLFIIADDQSPFDLKVYDPRSPLDTPVIDRLAADGLVFDGSYHMGAFIGGVCRPSRHMIMTGRTVWNLPNVRPPKKGSPAKKNTRHPLASSVPVTPFDAENDSLPAVFNKAGYDTMRTCKNGNSYEAANVVFTVRNDSTMRDGTDAKGSAWHAEQVLDYLDKRDGKPELLRKSGATNHSDKKSLPQLSPENPAPDLQVNYLPAHPFHHGHAGLRDEELVPGVWKNRDEATIRNEFGREYACSENIDIQIGRVLEKLEAMGEIDNTYIIYTSDHGIAIGRHGLQGKQNLYEHTWRVPFIIKGPGVRKGRALGNIYLLDVSKTLFDLAGIKAPEVNEGISYRPVIEGQRETVRDVLYGVYCGGTKPGMRCVKKGDWKLIKYDVLDGTVRETQLFVLAENPDELLKEHHDPDVVAFTGNQPNNLANDPKYARKLAEMEALLLSEQKRLGDPYRLWDQQAE